MNILADRHHGDLTWSLILLANRLGANIYFPRGMEWYDKGYYKLYGDLRKKDPFRYIAKQYLVDTLYERYEEGLWKSKESYKGCYDYPALKTLTLDEARKTPIDVVICSVNENEEPFLRLKEFYPQAKFIRQVGNDLDVGSTYPNLLSSAKIPYEAYTGKKLLYHPEFSHDLFSYNPIRRRDRIYSFQNNIEQFEDTWEVWVNLQHVLPNYIFRSYGRECEDGVIYPKQDLVEKMGEAQFIFQSKGMWEGYGFTIHQALCMGRPMIIKRSDYKGKIAEPMLIQDQTYLEMDGDLPEKIKFYSKLERVVKMSLACREAFIKNVDFDQEFVDIKQFFNTLI